MKQLLISFLVLSICLDGMQPNQQAAKSEQPSEAQKYVLQDLFNAIRAHRGIYMIDGDNAAQCTTIDTILKTNPEILEQTNAKQATPLLYAVWKGKEVVARHLIEQYKANWQAVDKYDRHLLVYAVVSDNRTLLMYIWNMFPQLQDMQKTIGRTLLLSAVKYKKYNSVKFLLTHASDAHIAVKDNDNKSVLDYLTVKVALEMLDIELAKWLLLRGAPLTLEALDEASAIDFANFFVTKIASKIEQQLQGWRDEYRASITTDIANGQRLPEVAPQLLPDLMRIVGEYLGAVFPKVQPSAMIAVASVACVAGIKNS